MGFFHQIHWKLSLDSTAGSKIVIIHSQEAVAVRTPLPTESIVNYVLLFSILDIFSKCNKTPL